MNWNTYKTLTNKQKDEYNFRFKEKEYFNLRGLTTLCILFVTTLTLFLMTIFIILTNSSFDKYKDKILLIVQEVAKMSKIMSKILIFCSVINILIITIKLFLEFKWRKKEGIKYIPFYKNE